MQLTKLRLPSMKRRIQKRLGALLDLETRHFWRSVTQDERTGGAPHNEALREMSSEANLEKTRPL